MCTIFSYKTEEEKLIIGRNFDWFGKGGRIHIQPPSRSYGLKTNGIIFIEQMGDDRPYDGMNDKGLFVGMAALMNTEIKDGFKDMNDLGLIKYILERATTAQEALDIAKRHKLDYMQDAFYPKVHYMFVDKNSNVIIYEEDKFEKHVNLNINEGEVITNFAYYNMLPCDRNDKVKEHFKNGISDENQAKLILEEVKQESSTVYSAIYNLELGFIRLWIEQDYKYEHRFNISDIEKGEDVIDFGELRLRANVNSTVWLGVWSDNDIVTMKRDWELVEFQTTS